MKRIIIRTKSGVVYDTEDYKITVSYYSLKVYNSKNLLEADSSFRAIYFDSQDTLYTLEDSNKLIVFKGDNVESLTIFN